MLALKNFLNRGQLSHTVLHIIHDIVIIELLMLFSMQKQDSTILLNANCSLLLG